MPWNTMIQWIEARIDYAKTNDGHTWDQIESNDLYRWTLSAANNNEKKYSSHYAEPPILVAIGYLGQIAYSHENPMDSVDAGAVLQGGLGTAALALSSMQPSSRPRDYTDRSGHIPLATLKNWIRIRIKAAALGDSAHGIQASWSNDLTKWTNCIVGNGNLWEQPPTALALGYILHTICNYTQVPNLTVDPLGVHAMECRILGTVFSAADLRMALLSTCDL